MSDEVRYCDECGKIISPADVKRRAASDDDMALCAACRSRSPDGADSVRQASRPGGAKLLLASIGGGLLLAIVVLLLTRGREEEEKLPPPPVVEPKPVALTKEPTKPVVPDNVVASAPAAAQVDDGAARRASEVRRRLDTLLEMIDPALSRYSEVRGGLLRLHADAAGTDVIEEILTVLAEIDRQYASLANAALEEARARANSIAAAGDMTAAIQVLREVENRFSAGPWLSARGSREIATAVGAIERLAATPKPVETSGGKSVVIQYIGQDKYVNDRLSGANTPGPVRDTWLRSDSPANEGFRNYHEFWVSTEYSTDRRNGYGLIRFDLPELKAGSVVSAKLHVYAWNDSPTGGIPVSVYPLLKAWNETSIGACFDSRERETPWNPGKTPSSFDANPATTTDFDPKLKSHLADAKRNQWNVWDVTPIVSAWLDGSLPNRGLVLLGDQIDSTIRCYSSNHYDDSLPDKGVSLRPKLEIVLK